MKIRRMCTLPVAAVAAAALVCVIPAADSPPGQRVTGFESTVSRPGDRSREQPPVRGQAGPIVGGLSASSVGVLVVDGGRHQCSAAVVASQSRRLLATAAHCVWLDGAWRLDGAYFIPGWAGGEEPYGHWAVDTAYLPPAWQRAASPIEDVAADTDFAFVSLLPREGRLPEQALGAQGIRWAVGEQVEVAALGYPALGSYDGQSLRGCVGSATVEDFAHDPGQPTGRVLAMECDMTEGASGGPWLTGPDASEGRGQLVGVVSGGDDRSLVSPLFDEAARAVYDAADSASLSVGAETQ